MRSWLSGRSREDVPLSDPDGAEELFGTALMGGVAAVEKSVLAFDFCTSRP
jgi:hypothetical protein